MVPPRGYVNDREPNEIRMRIERREREWSEFSAVKEEAFG
jgi:hypothetical protein